MENLHTEYKREIIKYEKLHRSLVAFSNTEGGLLYIGVDDNGDFYETPKQSFDSIYQGLAAHSNDSLKLQINKLWKIEEHLWKNNNKHLVYKIVATISDFAIATINNGAIKCYVRIETITNEVDCKEVNKNKNELTPTNHSFDLNNFKGLVSIEPQFKKASYRKSYGIVNQDDKITILGSYLSDAPTTDIKYNNETIRIANIQDTFNKISKSFEEVRNYGVYRVSYKEMVGRINEVARELIINAIAHGRLEKEIKIGFKNGIFYVENNWPSLEKADQFITNLLKNKIIHHDSFYHTRNRVLKELKMMETSSRGYNNIITPKEDYWILLLKKQAKIKILVIAKKIKSENEIKAFLELEKKKERKESYWWK